MNRQRPTARLASSPAARASGRVVLGTMAALLILSSAMAAESAGTGWALRYAGRSTNDAIQDPRMAATLRALVPAPLVEPVTLDLWGPPEPVLRTGPWVTMSACRPHDCGSKALLWLDTAHDGAIAATADCGLYQIRGDWKWRACRLSLGSRVYDAGTIPTQARDALKAWITDRDMAIISAQFIGADEVARPLNPADFHRPDLLIENGSEK